MHSQSDQEVLRELRQTLSRLGPAQRERLMRQISALVALNERAVSVRHDPEGHVLIQDREAVVIRAGHGRAAWPYELCLIHADWPARSRHWRRPRRVALPMDIENDLVNSIQRVWRATLMQLRPRIHSSPVDAAPAETTVFEDERPPDIHDESEMSEAEAAAAYRALATPRPDREPAYAMWSAQQVGERLGRSRATINNWRRRGQILGLPRAGHGYDYPADQFIREPSGRYQRVPGIPQILAVMAPDAAWNWLTMPRADLDAATSLAKLQQGEIDAVMDRLEANARGAF